MPELLFAYAAGLSTAYLLWFAYREGKKRRQSDGFHPPTGRD
jgi:hypothetical protein